MRTKLMLAATLAAWAFFDPYCSITLAVPLNPGDTVALSGTTLAARPELAGVIEAEEIRPFSINLGGSVSGTILDRVVRESDTGTLDFYMQINLDSSSAGSIGFIVREKFSNFTTDVDYRTDSLGSAGPDSAFRIAAFDGEEIRFDFAPANRIAPGESSYFFFVKTDATQFAATGTSFLFGQTATGGGNFLTLQPTFEPVPEPSALVLGSIGLLSALPLCRRRIRRRAIGA